MTDQEPGKRRRARTSEKVTMNRRDASRVAVKPAYSSVAVTSSGLLEPLTGHVYDISEKGLRFEVDRALPVGSAVELELLVPPEESIRVTARVVRVFDEADDPGPRRMGAEFTGFGSPDDAVRLAGLLDSYQIITRAA
ncbi:MAG: PilZ domain-containing protein [Phycisphaerae bacterium]|nr:PilZ domain-containing protein [Phycisphaerae bacterium]